MISPSTDPKGVEFDDFSLSLSMRYPLAVQGAGGQPWMCPCVPEREFVAEAVRRSDGVLLTGGDDVEPQLYGEKPASAVAATVHPEAPERDLFELMLIDEVFRQQKPLLAICRGLQILNVALGGTLIADIPSQVPGALRHNRSDRKDRIVHDVAVVPGSHLGRLAPSGRLGVNSSHHQAVAKLAKPLRATAVSKDGIIEGLELAPHAAWMTRYLLAVQFHPERLFTRHAEHLALFQGFIRACRRAVDGDRV
ncbi:MAG TPA: gamma-glutamyl-gamma-aminobutyrate hydrolase family protein [Methylomirabilota bacterium]|nr:gamma-glutamyl-gamma-aminobutyrate hydrolase family protein [Methylomirabilota bacterium]